jgi:tetratricopeptide (TPR) repeat protein
VTQAKEHFMSRTARASSLAFISVTLLLIISFEAKAQSENGWSEVEILNRDANTKITEKQYKTAIDLLNKAIAIQPDFAKAYINLGTAYFFTGELEKAASHIKKGVELRPDYYEGYNQLGVVYTEQGKFDLAIASLKMALDYKPDYAIGLYNLGTVYTRVRKLKPAISAFEKAKALAPENDKIRFNLGLLYATQSRYGEAIAELKIVTRDQPEDDEAKLALCQIYLLANDRQSAINMYRAFKSVNLPLAEKMFTSISKGRVISAENDK